MYLLTSTEAFNNANFSFVFKFYIKIDQLQRLTAFEQCKILPHIKFYNRDWWIKKIELAQTCVINEKSKIFANFVQILPIVPYHG